ncbi:hypothetical protein HYW74_01770 [Candidatus Pacearchaeota archaeon]|nr:hypothetical protein [Candidatus Pacearchaeota archaeon]
MKNIKIDEKLIINILNIKNNSTSKYAAYNNKLARLNNPSHNSLADNFTLINS